MSAKAQKALLNYIKPTTDRIVVRIIPEIEPLVRWVKEDAHSFNSHHLVPAEDADYRRVILCGVVVSIGPKVTGVKPGQEIHFTDWNDADLSDYGKDLQMIREGDILGIAK